MFGGGNAQPVLGNVFGESGCGRENFPLDFGKGVGGRWYVGKKNSTVFGKGIVGENMLNVFRENDILQLHIHPPFPLRGRGALRRDEATKKAALRAAFLSTSFLPGGIGF